MTLRLNGSTSGYTEIDAPAVAGSNTLVLPTGNGTADQALVTNGSGTLSFADRGRMQLATAQDSTSGTSIDFTGIPSWAKRVTIMFNGVSTNGTSQIAIRVGAGSIQTTGYQGSGIAISATGQTLANRTTNLAIDDVQNAAAIRTGFGVLSNFSGNTWVWTASSGREDNATYGHGAGKVVLSGTLDRLRITTVNGTDTFDAGSVNILIEG